MATVTPKRYSWLTPAMLLLLLILEHGALAKPSSPPKDTDSIYESCGTNMVCVPRFQCQNNVSNDGGFEIRNPIIQSQTDCCRYMYTCCKEEKVVASPYTK